MAELHVLGQLVGASGYEGDLFAKVASPLPRPPTIPPPQSSRSVLPGHSSWLSLLRASSGKGKHQQELGG